MMIKLIPKEQASKPLITKMLYFNMHIAFLLFYFLIWFGPKSEATPTYINHFCGNISSNFTPNSIYQSNLNHLLSFLSSNSSTFEFYNATAGQHPSTSVYGLFLCRGDVNTSVCQDCVTYATTDIVKRCPVERETVIWYDECQLRYSSRSLFGILDEFPLVALVKRANITDQGRFLEVLNVTMKAAAAEAANGGQKKFKTKEANFSAFQTLYSLVQCTPDLSSADCNRCLLDAFEDVYVYSYKQGARKLFPSCNVGFELYPFYNLTASPPSPPLSPPPSPPPSPPLASVTRPKEKTKISSVTIMAIVASIVASGLLFGMGYCFLRRRAVTKNNALTQENAANDITSIQSLQFDFKSIETATSKFSDCNKLGKGGFGEVYKGILINGSEIAVKRLSKSSGQGAEEFKNEVVVVAKLQHKNLVRLWGFCLEGEEKILVYEYVPNKSLDYFLFDPEKRGKLDWPIRCNVIGGIARGILYLHEDSRLKVIHRDLKASNILLDKNMNPKISDFGMAKMFGVDQIQGNTARIVGTYGYMAPEYAMEGLYSTKSDVFSFGVLLLEILSGRRNTGFHLTDCAPSLVAYAWQLWNESKGLELMDPLMNDSCLPNEFLRYVHIGLLCVQEEANRRPTMSTVVLVLKSESFNLAQPQKPAFCVGRFTESNEIVGIEICSGNTTTFSDFLPR